MERRVRAQRRRRWNLTRTTCCPVRRQRDRVVFGQRIGMRFGSLFSWFWGRFGGISGWRLRPRWSKIGCLLGIAIGQRSGLRVVRRLRKLRGRLRSRSSGILACGKWSGGRAEPTRTKGQPTDPPRLLDHAPPKLPRNDSPEPNSHILAFKPWLRITILCRVFPAAYARFAGHTQLPVRGLWTW